jgi:DNA invertase Pin-like site-specific DNA recombinase
MKKAILYARVAILNEEQEPNRLEHQINELKICCQDNNIKVVGIYYEACSGATFKRKEFQNLLKDIKTKKVKADVLLFTNWDRFSRNLLEAEKMKTKLKKMGVEAKAIHTDFNTIKLYDLFTSKKSKK